MLWLFQLRYFCENNFKTLTFFQLVYNIKSDSFFDFKFFIYFQPIWRPTKSYMFCFIFEQNRNVKLTRFYWHKLGINKKKFLLVNILLSHCLCCFHPKISDGMCFAFFVWKSKRNSNKIIKNKYFIRCYPSNYKKFLLILKKYLI